MAGHSSDSIGKFLRSKAQQTALFFDCDGVLAPIVAHADDATVPDSALRLLASAAREFKVVGVVSGKS